MIKNFNIQEFEFNYEDIIVAIVKWMQGILTSIGVPEHWIILVKLIASLFIVVISVYILQLLTRKLITFILNRISKIFRGNFFHHAVTNKFPHYLGLIVPYSFVKGVIPIVFYDIPFLVKPLLKLTNIYLVFMFIWIIMSLLKSFFDNLQDKEQFKNKPMKSYLQVIQIILFILGGVVIFSILSGMSTTAIFAGMGAASAVLMLLFKDSLMGFVGSIQVSANNLVQLGDWITVTKYGANGYVEEINLTTVKVRNFDKTITTVPTYSLISESFQNWRAMQESGGRRGKRSIFVKQSSIHFLTNDELEKYKSIDGLSEFIEAQQSLFGIIKQDSKDALSTIEHSLTNNDLFMQYATLYLKKHPQINNDMTLMVRQLEPTTTGLPIEIYAFTNTTVWLEHESIMSGIINHLLCTVNFFGLLVFEQGSGSDDYNVFLNQVESNKQIASNKA